MRNYSVGDATEFIRGITFKPDQLVDKSTPDAVVCMRTKNVQVDALDQSDLIAVPKALVRNDDKMLRNGDILISSANSWELVGKCSFVPKLNYPATAGGFIGIVRPKKNTNARFLYHWMANPKSQFNFRHCGRQTTNISNLDIGRFKELRFPNFDITEQKRIAAILDKADAIRRKRQQALTLADEFLKSVFLEMFGDPVSNPKGWDINPLSNSIDEIRYGTSTKCSSQPVDGSLPVLRIPNISMETVNWQQLKYTQLSDREIDRLLLRSGDILFVRSNGNPNYIGRCAVFEGDRAAIFASYLIRARLSETSKVHYDFVAKCLSMPSYRHRLVREAKTTAGNYNVNTKSLRSLPIIEPPIKLQHQFLSIATSIRDSVNTQSTSLKQANNLFASLSQRAFRGEL